MADFQGGLVVIGSAGENQTTIQKLDGATGQPYPAYTTTAGVGLPVLVHTDGTLFVADNGSIVGIDPLTGTAKFSIALPQSVGSANGNCNEYTPWQQSYPTNPVQGIIGGDGYAYFTFEYSLEPLAKNTKNCYEDGSSDGATYTESHSRILQVGTDGSSTLITVGDSTTQSSFTCTPVNPPPNGGGECPGILSSASTSSNTGVTLGYIMTNADQGVLMSSSDCSQGPCIGQLSVFNGGSLTSTATTQVPIVPKLQAADGSFVGMSGANMVGFDLSGNIKWSVSNYTPLIETADGGTIAQSFSSSSVSSFDQYGNATGIVGTGAGVKSINWGANASVGASPLGSTLVSTVVTAPLYAPSYTAMGGGNQSGNGTPILQVLSIAGPTSPLEKQLPSAGTTLYTNFNKTEIFTTISPDSIFSSYILSFDGAGRLPNLVPTGLATIISSPAPPVTQTGQTVTFQLNSFLGHTADPYGCGPLGDFSCGVLQEPFSIQIERLDNDILAACTLTGHPLEGWRYWRVHSLGTDSSGRNDVVIETGAVDTYAHGPSIPRASVKNFLGYFVFARGQQLKIWEDDFRYVLAQIENSDRTAVIVADPDNWIEGKWNPLTPSKSDIFYNVCQSTNGCN